MFTLDIENLVHVEQSLFYHSNHQLCVPYTALTVTAHIMYSKKYISIIYHSNYLSWAHSTAMIAVTHLVENYRVQFCEVRKILILIFNLGRERI